MRTEGKRAIPNIARTPDRVVEDGDFYIERYADGTVRVTVDRAGVLVTHIGTPAAVRARLAVDAPANIRTAVDVAVRDIATAQATR